MTHHHQASQPQVPWQTPLTLHSMFTTTEVADITFHACAGGRGRDHSRRGGCPGCPVPRLPAGADRCGSGVCLLQVVVCLNACRGSRLQGTVSTAIRPQSRHALTDMQGTESACRHARNPDPRSTASGPHSEPTKQAGPPRLAQVRSSSRSGPGLECLQMRKVQTYHVHYVQPTL